MLIKKVTLIKPSAASNGEGESKFKAKVFQFLIIWNNI